MKKLQIDKLIEKYMEGRSSIDEEKLLKDYFSGDNIDEKHKTYQPLFIGLNKLGKREQNKYLHEKILNAALHLYKNHNKTKKRWIYTITSISAAAIIAILIGLPSQQPQWEDTYSNPKQAYEQARKTLIYASEKYNKGMGQLSRLTVVNESIEPLQKSFSTINSGVATYNKSMKISNLKNE